MADTVTEPQKSLHHLLVISDGEVLVNELFNSKRELADSFIAGLREGSYDLGIDTEDVKQAILDADEEAAAADYPEGITPPVRGDSEEYLDMLSDLLGNENVDLHIHTISVRDAGD